MSVSNKNKHLTVEERLIICNAIINGSTKQAMANVLGKHKSTIGKEIKLHRTLSSKCKLPLECSNYKKCEHSRQCTLSCPNYTQFKCTRRDRSPGACNGCSLYSRCRFDKFKYEPNIANIQYHSQLVSCRSGVNATIEEIRELGNLILPLLLKGQSVYQILASNPAIQQSEKTIYTYIEDGIFKEADIDIDAFLLRRQLNRKLPKKKENGFKKRQDRSFLKGRLYKDFEVFIEENPSASIVEMDTVYNDGSNGPFIQTFKFRKYGFLFAILHDTKTSASMNQGVALLEEILTPSLFKKEVEVLLTDRGTEFSGADEIEMGVEGTRRTFLFYCDAMCSHQKGSIENNHTQLRYILPKGTDLRALGLQTQDDLNKVLSHINSFPKEKLNGKSSIETLQFFNSSLAKKLDTFGIKMIASEEIVLKPYLLKK